VPFFLSAGFFSMCYYEQKKSGNLVVGMGGWFVVRFGVTFF
jgi:hypothetical protein